MWEEEKHQLDKNHTRYCAGLKDGDNLAGVILITSSSSKKRLAYDEVEIISNITSVASIAIKMQSCMRMPVLRQEPMN